MDNDTLSKLVDVYSNVINARACLDIPDSVRGYLNTAADLLNQIADAYDLSLPMDPPDWTDDE